MDTTATSESFFQNGWSIYLIAIVVFTVLFFIQKYTYLIDKQINKKQNINGTWEGKPWPLISGLLLGLLVYILSVFLPGELNLNPVNWHYPEIIICSFAVIIFVILAIESIAHFGWGSGLLRLIILVILSTAFFYAGLLAGLLISLVLIFAIIIYFLFFWKKRLTIN